MAEMKDSGIDWVGKIPENWRVLKNKYNFELSKEIIGTKWVETQLLSLTKYGIKAINDGEQTGKVPASLSTYQKVNKDDLVMCLFDLDCSAVFSGISDFDGMVSPAYKCIKCKAHLFPKYIDYYFRTVFVDRKYKRYSKNVRFSISADEFMNLPIIVPPKDMQINIAKFLDKKCAEVDALHTDIEKQIETLEEYKKSIITEAVTKGLDPDVEMKDSGIEWVGMIPKNWNVTRIGYESWIRARLGWKGLKAEEYVLEGHPFLSAFNIIQNKISWDELNYITNERYNESPEIMLKVGDIVLVKDGAGIGKCAKIDSLPYETATTNGSLAVISSTVEKLDYNYLYFYLQSAMFQNYILRIMNGMGVPHLSQEELRKIKIPFPPINEQIEIAKYLEKKRNDIDMAILEKIQQLETLEQYKKSVIYEYVTGKKEVQ